MWAKCEDSIVKGEVSICLPSRNDTEVQWYFQMEVSENRLGGGESTTEYVFEEAGNESWWLDNVVQQ